MTDLEDTIKENSELLDALYDTCELCGVSKPDVEHSLLRTKHLCLDCFFSGSWTREHKHE